MTTIKQLSKIKNLLIEAKELSIGMDDFHVTSKLDMAMYNVILSYEQEENRLRAEGKDGNDLLLMIRN